MNDDILDKLDHMMLISTSRGLRLLLREAAMEIRQLRTLELERVRRMERVPVSISPHQSQEDQ